MAAEYFFPSSFFPPIFLHSLFARFPLTSFFFSPHEGGFECACSNRNPLFVSIILAASFFIVTPFLCSAREYRWWIYIFFFWFFRYFQRFAESSFFYSNSLSRFFPNFFFFHFGILQLARCISVFYPVI